MRITDLTEEQWLARCRTAYQVATKGLCPQDVDLKLLERVVDAVMRLEGGQLHYWTRFLEEERGRTDMFAPEKTLANDRELYNALYLTSMLCHPCQECAEDPDAWHTRPAFCNHKKRRG